MKHYITILISLFMVPAFAYSQCDYSYGNWETTLSPMPTPRAVFSAVNHNDSIYILGGFLNLAAPECVSSVDVYVPATDTWINGITEFPFPRRCQNACLIGDKIYAFGGAHVNGENITMYDSLHIYDIQSNTWERGACLPAPRSYFSADTIDGKIYVAGGGNGWSIKNTLYVYDPALDEWTEKAPMNNGRWGACARSWNGKLYVFGGHIGSSWTITKSLEVYDPETDEWTLLSDARTQRAVHAMFLLEDQLYAIGGYNDYSPTEHYHTAIISRYDINPDSWFDFHHPEDNIPDGRRYSAVSIVNDKFYFFGGGSDVDINDNAWAYSFKGIQQNEAINDTTFSSVSIEIDLAPYFSSSGDEALSYSVCEGYNSEIVDVYLENSTLKIDWLAEGVEGTELAVNVYSTTDTVSSNSFTLEMPASTQTHFETQNQISIYPNPASSVAVITFDIAETGMATLEIYNTKGQLLEQLNFEDIAADGLSFEWNVEDYYDGIYFAVLKTRRSTSISKLVIQH